MENIFSLSVDGRQKLPPCFTCWLDAGIIDELKSKGIKGSENHGIKWVVRMQKAAIRIGGAV